MMRISADGAGALVFGIVLLAAGAVLGGWAAVAGEDVDTARRFALEATGSLPFGDALTHHALRNLHVVAAVALVVCLAGIASIADAFGVPAVSGLLRLATGSVIFAVGAALGTWTLVAIQDPAQALAWANQAEELVPAVNEFANAALAQLPAIGAAAAFLVLFGAAELVRSRHGLRSLSRRDEPRDEGDMRLVAPKASTAARLDLLEPAMQTAAAAPAPVLAVEHFTAPDPPVVKSIERMIVRLGIAGSKPLTARQKAALLKSLTPDQQATIAKLADRVPSGQKVAIIAVAIFVALQVIPSLIGALIGR
jgi:hypothetical protein